MTRCSRNRALGAIVCSACVIAAVLAGASSAFAEFGVYPSRVEASAKQGETVKFEIKASTVDVDNPMQVILSAWDFARDSRGEPRRIAPEDAERFRGCSSWLEWFPGSATIDPGDERSFMFTADVPKDAEDGTHYCYVTFSGTPVLESMETPESGQAMRTPLGFAVSALVLVSVGDTSTAAPVVEADALVKAFNMKTFNLNQSVPMEVTLVNSGNVHLSMTDASRIEIMRGKYKEADIPIQSYTLLPANTLVIPAVWEPDSPFGIYTARFYADVGLDAPMTAEHRFFVLSWPAIIGLVSALIIIGLATWLFFSRFRIQLAPKGGNPPESAA